LVLPTWWISIKMYRAWSASQGGHEDNVSPRDGFLDMKGWMSGKYSQW